MRFKFSCVDLFIVTKHYSSTVDKWALYQIVPWLNSAYTWVVIMSHYSKFRSGAAVSPAMSQKTCALQVWPLWSHPGGGFLRVSKGCGRPRHHIKCRNNRDGRRSASQYVSSEVKKLFLRAPVDTSLLPPWSLSLMSAHTLNTVTGNRSTINPEVY